MEISNKSLLLDERQDWSTRYAALQCIAAQRHAEADSPDPIIVKGASASPAAESLAGQVFEAMRGYVKAQTNSLQRRVDLLEAELRALKGHRQ